MSPSHFLCWDSSDTLCPKPYFSRSFAEITGNTPQQWASPCCGFEWKLDATAAASISRLYPFFKSQVLSFHFQEVSATTVTFFFNFISNFFTKFVTEKDRSSSGTPDSGCSGLLLLLAAAPPWYRDCILLGQKATPNPTCFTPHIT